MYDIYEIMNAIDDNASLVKHTKKLSESHSRVVKRRLTEADEQPTDTKTTSNDNRTDATASVNNVIDQLRKIDNYEQFIKALKSLSADQKQNFIKNFGVVDAIKPATASKGIPVTKLRPTQSEIDWKKSLSYGLKQDCSYFFKSPVELGMPVLTYKSTYIIDGHHRWSQVFMFNPKAEVSCIDFNYDQGTPTDVLKDFQGAVLATTGNVAVGTAGTNIWTVSEEELRKFIEENMVDACWESLVNAKVATDRASAIEYIIRNAMVLKNKIRPTDGAPDRVDMPQTNKEVVAKAAKAMSDMSEDWRDTPYRDNSQADRGKIKAYQAPKGESNPDEWKSKARDSEEQNRRNRRNPWESLSRMNEASDDYFQDKYFVFVDISGNLFDIREKIRDFAIDAGVPSNAVKFYNKKSDLLEFADAGATVAVLVDKGNGNAFNDYDNIIVKEVPEVTNDKWLETAVNWIVDSVKSASKNNTLKEGDDYWRDRPYRNDDQKDRGKIKAYQKPDSYSGSQNDWTRNSMEDEERNKKLRRNPWE